MLTDIEWIIDKLHWMRRERIWPNGLRYLWTDAFGVVLLVSLRNKLLEDRYLDDARWVVAEVDRVLGRPIGMRIGQQPDRDGQYYHYLAMWMFALSRLGQIDRTYRDRAIELARAIHPRFVIPGVGVRWKMLEDLSGPYPPYGLGSLDPFHGYVVYRLLDPERLGGEIEELRQLVEHSYPRLIVTQDLGLGMLLWMSHFFPEEPWAVTLRNRSLAMLDRMWVDPPGYFCREPSLRHVKFAFTNFGVSMGLQAVNVGVDRVSRLNHFFETYRSRDEYDFSAITHVMACASHFAGELLAKREF